MRGEQILSSLPQVLKQFLFVLQQSIQATIEPIFFRHREVRFQQLGHCGLIEPLSVHPELAARIGSVVKKG